MQSTTGQTKRRGTSEIAPKTSKPVRKKLAPLTIVIASLTAIASVGIMLVVLLGYWPPKSSPELPAILGPTPIAIQNAGLTAEKAGPIISDTQHPGQIIVPVKVSNNVKKSAKLHITPTPGVEVPTPTPAPAVVLNADIRVIFYKREGEERKIAGAINGNATNIQYGESKIVNIVGTGIDNPQSLEYDVLIDSMWTDKDAFLKQDSAFASHPAYLPRNP